MSVHVLDGASIMDWCDGRALLTVYVCVCVCALGGQKSVSAHAMLCHVMSLQCTMERLTVISLSLVESCAKSAQQQNHKTNTLKASRNHSKFAANSHLLLVKFQKCQPPFVLRQHFNFSLAKLA